MQIGGSGLVNTNCGPGPVKTNWGPGPVNTSWGPGLGLGPGKYEHPCINSLRNIFIHEWAMN